MKPFSRVIQLVAQNIDERKPIKFLALCEDGSIWWYYPEVSAEHRWKLREEYDEATYESAR